MAVAPARVALRGLTPLDVVDLRFHEDLTGRVLVYLVESSGREISAKSASDGTLRFLALAAALLSSESGHVFFIEEIDNGLHPTRLHLLLDVIEQATRNLGCQVIATTHNPQLLAYLSPEAREDAVLLYRREHEDASEAIRIVAAGEDAKLNRPALRHLRGGCLRRFRLACVRRLGFACGRRLRVSRRGA